MQQASYGNIINVSLTLANTEYSANIPSGAKSIAIRFLSNLGNTQVLYSYLPGYVVSGTDKCVLITSDERVQINYLVTGSLTIYFSSNKPGTIIQIEYWL